jgi:thiamine-phosphate pyrophosphorylase
VAYAAAASIAERCRAAGATCIVNDRADLAMAVGADGVHVGADDLPVGVARRLLGPAALVGGTARNPADAERHRVAGASYVGVGPVCATASKTGLPEPLGPAVVRAVADAVAIPVIAIAGVTVERVDELIAAGAHGVAVIGAVARAPDPEAATAAFVAALARAVGERAGVPT